MKKFYLKSMGCKSNQFEGQIVTEKLVSAGFEAVRKIEDADFYILNSCSVTHKSDNEAMYLLRHAKNLGLKTVLTGCVAQIEKEKLLKEPFIDAVYGNEDKFNIVELLKESDVFCLPSYSEGFPTCVLEALICNSFVITTKRGDAKEIIKNRDYGIILPDANEDGLYEALVGVLDKKEYRESAIKLSREIVVNNYTWKKLADKFLSIID